MSGSPQKKTLRARQSSLMILSSILIVSGVFRLIPLASPALARVGLNEAAQAPETVAMDMSDPGVDIVLQRLLDREAFVEKRENAIKDREIALKIAEDAISTKLEELIEVEKTLSATIAKAEVAFEEDVANLTQVFGQMKPKQAAALFGEMEPGFAAGFLARLPAEASAGILAAMDPRDAYSISVVMAGRNANVPNE